MCIFMYYGVNVYVRIHVCTYKGQIVRKSSLCVCTSVSMHVCMFAYVHTYAHILCMHICIYHILIRLPQSDENECLQRSSIVTSYQDLCAKKNKTALPQVCV
jgi:hypothetical protein